MLQIPGADHQREYAAAAPVPLPPPACWEGRPNFSPYQTVINCLLSHRVEYPPGLEAVPAQMQTHRPGAVSHTHTLNSPTHHQTPPASHIYPGATYPNLPPSGSARCLAITRVDELIDPSPPLLFLSFLGTFPAPFSL